LGVAPLLLSATNVLRLQRPTVFCQVVEILDSPLGFLSSSQRDHLPHKAVRFAASIHSEASTPRSEVEQGDAFSEERHKERQAFAKALNGSPQPAELLPRLKKVLLVVRAEALVNLKLTVACRRTTRSTSD
jgi:hypothetical protein